MNSGQNAAGETASGLGWARRVLCQQLDALSRLTAIAWRLLEPPTPPADSSDPATFFAALRGFEKAVRRQVRVDWVLRLIGALRDKLRAELEAIDNGQAPAPPVAAANPAAEGEPGETLNPKEGSDRPERENLHDYERFTFQGRAAEKKLAEILKRPTAEIIALICRELGLPDDWPRVAEEEWAREEAEDWGEPPGASELEASIKPPRMRAAPS
jgi:hypothetical protein